MSTKKDGGPAFPFVEFQFPGGASHASFSPGMSLRDWFAGQAIASGLVKDSYPDWQLNAWFGKYATGIEREKIAAKAAYAYADAMLKAREVSP